MGIASTLWGLEFVFTLVPYSIFVYHLPLIILSPIYLVSRKSWYWIERGLYNMLPYLLLNYAVRRRFRFKAFGEYEKLRSILRDRPDDLGIVIANHQTPTDVILVTNFWASIVPNENHFSDITWIQDFMLGFAPTGWVAKMHGDFFLLQPVNINPLTKCLQCSRSSTKLKQFVEPEIREYVKYSLQNRHRLITLFPEGGFLNRRKAGSQRFAQKNGLPVLEHVAIPRSNGLAYVLDELYRNDMVSSQSSKGRKARHLVTLTLVYPDIEKPWSLGKVTASPMLGRQSETCYVHVKIDALDSVPKPNLDKGISNPAVDKDLPLPNLERPKSKYDDPFEKYLLNAFVQMDRRLEQFYKHGSSVEEVGKFSDIQGSTDLKLSRFWLTIHYFISVVIILGLVTGIIFLIVWAVR